MPKEDNDFNQTIKNDESGINEGDEKIDTTPDNEEETEEQKKASQKFEDKNDDTSVDDSEDEESDDDSKDEEKESEDDESDKDSDNESDEESDDESDEGESDNTDEEGEEESESEEDSDDDTKPKWEEEGFKDEDAYKTYLEKHPEPTKLESDKNKDNLSEAEKQKDSVFTLFDKHPDVLPKSAKENYQKFYDSGNNAFLHLDDHLHKFSNALDKISEKLPFDERISEAFKLAFTNETSKLERKKGEVKAELRTQKVNKSASKSTKGDDSKSSKETHTPEQLEVARKMGVKLN